MHSPRKLLDVLTVCQEVCYLFFPRTARDIFEKIFSLWNARLYGFPCDVVNSTKANDGQWRKRWEDTKFRMSLDCVDGKVHKRRTRFVDRKPMRMRNVRGSPMRSLGRFWADRVKQDWGIWGIRIHETWFVMSTPKPTPRREEWREEKKCTSSCTCSSSSSLMLCSKQRMQCKRETTPKQQTLLSAVTV